MAICPSPRQSWAHGFFAATGHAAAGYKLGESMPFSLIYLALALGGCMLSAFVFFPF